MTNELLKRRSNRLQGYDYTQPGAYFLTLVTHNRIPVLGNIDNGIVIQTPLGKLVQNEWYRLPLHFTFLELDTFIVMPDHLHGIILINDIDNPDQQRGLSHNMTEYPLYKNRSGNRPEGVIKGSIGEIIQYFKSQTTLRFNRITGQKGKTLWMRNYYDRIIRNDAEWEKIRQYIELNPSRWEDDRLDSSYSFD